MQLALELPQAEIRGSNLDKPLTESNVDLTHAGLQRHRVLWIREMSEEDIRTVGETAPTIDSIEVAEFASHLEGCCPTSLRNDGSRL